MTLCVQGSAAPPKFDCKFEAPFSGVTRGKTHGALSILGMPLPSRPQQTTPRGAWTALASQIPLSWALLSRFSRKDGLSTKGLCKVVGTHRVLHLGSIERERVTREWASDVPCGYYGMIYLGGVYILGVHMGHKFISFSLLAWSIGLDASLSKNLS